MRKLSRCFLVGLALVFGLSMVGCGGGGGGGDGGGTGTTSRQVEQNYDEQCKICHGSGTAQDVANLTQVGMPHYIGTGSPRVTVTAVREVNVSPVPPIDDRLEVDFTIVDSTTGAIVTGVPAANIRFTLARLDVSSGVTNWQSYINTGTSPTVRATSERANAAGGIFTDNSIPLGTYSYRFSFNMNAVTTPVAVSYLRTATHRIAMQVSDIANNINVDNAFMDFIPSSLPTLGVPAAANRKISVNASCNQCHVRLGFHGGGRINVEYCVTCHNPGSTDPTSRNTVDFKVMIHKIHNGQDGYRLGAAADYSSVVYPQDIRNCTKCHTYSASTTPQGDNWKNVPTTESCTSCHDDPGTIPTFPNLTPTEITNTHVIPEAEAAKRFKYNIITPITNTAPGQFPVIRFSVQNPQDPAYNAADPRTATYNILTAKEFNSGSASTLNVLISWPTKDYTNTGSLRTPAQPISINPRVGAVNNGDGTFTVASSVPIPAGVTGSGTVAIEGHPAVESVPGSGTYDLRVPATGAVKSFAITDATAQDRRTVVDTAKCEQCHGLLSLHGANRNRNTQLCVICHNANATDINRRPASGVGTDGKAEEAIDFKYMIHSIHAGKAGTGYDGFRTNGLVVYGFGGATDFSEVRMPTGAAGSGPNQHLNIKNCLGCHIAGTFGLPVNANALPTTTKTGSDKSSPDDDENITPTASVCSSCHDDIDSQTHMAFNGAKFDFKAYVTVVEGGSGGGSDQAALCGPGPVSSQPTGHTSRTDCCSCHSPR